VTYIKTTDKALSSGACVMKRPCERHPCPPKKETFLRKDRRPTVFYNMKKHFTSQREGVSPPQPSAHKSPLWPAKQVGAIYQGHDPDRDSSREVVMAPGIKRPNAQGSDTLRTKAILFLFKEVQQPRQEPPSARPSFPGHLQRHSAHFPVSPGSLW